MAVQTRPPSGARTRPTGGGKAAAGKGGSAKSPVKTPAKKATPATSSTQVRSRNPQKRTAAPAGPGLPVRVVRAGWRLLVIIWTIAARLTGQLTRALGQSAAHLDPQHRRDGRGLAVLVAAVLTGASLWVGVDGPLGRIVVAGVAGAFGQVALAAPVVLAWGAWRLLRQPGDPTQTSRLVLGAVLTALGTCGLAHLVAGSPVPRDGEHAMRGAGGLVGWVAAVPLADAASVWATVPVLLIFAGYGVLLLSATPLHEVPLRFQGLRRAPVDDSHDDEQWDEHDDAERGG